jgi:23S rRNA-/tRNA-specific pseudouridylate synthase
MQPLRVLYADAALLVISKPAGLLSVPGRGAANLSVNAVTLLRGWLNGGAVGEAGAAPHVDAWARRGSIFHSLPAVGAASAANASSLPAARGARRRALRAGALPFLLPQALLEPAGSPGHGTQPELEPLVVHRLDQDTSGVMVFAHTYAVQRALAVQFEARQATKLYEAVLDTRALEAAAAAAAASVAAGAGAPAEQLHKDGPGGTVAPSLSATVTAYAASALLWEASGEVSTPLGRHSHVPLLQAAECHADAAAAGSTRPAATRWRVLERGRGAVRVELQPLTGRTHQLRLHMALPPPFGLGAPIIGDRFYGDPELARDSYLLELAADAERHDTAAAQAGSNGPTCANNEDAAAARRTAVRLVMEQHAARAALLPALPGGRDGSGAHTNAPSGIAASDANAAGGGGGVAGHQPLPFLSSCRFLDRASPEAIHPGAPGCPRLLLHARELHLVDHFQYAGTAKDAAASVSIVAVTQAADLRSRLQAGRDVASVVGPHARSAMHVEQREDNGRLSALDVGPTVCDHNSIGSRPSGAGLSHAGAALWTVLDDSAAVASEAVRADADLGRVASAASLMDRPRPPPGAVAAYVAAVPHTRLGLIRSKSMPSSVVREESIPHRRIVKFTDECPF